MTTQSRPITRDEVAEVMRLLGLWADRPMKPGEAFVYQQAFAGKADRELFTRALEAWMHGNAPGGKKLPAAKELRDAMAVLKPGGGKLPNWEALGRSTNLSAAGKELLRLTTLLTAGHLGREAYWSAIEGMEDRWPNEGYFELARQMRFDAARVAKHQAAPSQMELRARLGIREDETL